MRISNNLKFTLVSVALIFSSQSYASSPRDIFDCTVTDWTQTNPYSKEFAQAYVPQEFQLEIFDNFVVGKTAFVPNGVRGVFVSDTGKKLIFDFQDTESHYKPRTRYTLFKSNNKIVAKTSFNGGYLPVGPVWGVCIKTPVSKIQELSEGQKNNQQFSLSKEDFKDENKKNQGKSSQVQSDSQKMKSAAKECEEIGFKKGTELFGECVIRMLDGK